MVTKAKLLTAVAIAALLLSPVSAHAQIKGGGGRPSGFAGGDLSGSYPAPLVSKVGGKSITLSGTFYLSGGHNLTAVIPADSTVTFPASGTLAALSAGNIPLADLATQATNTIVGNATAGTASPTALSIGSCSTSGSALKWTTSSGFGCNTSILAATSTALAANGANCASNTFPAGVDASGAVESCSAVALAGLATQATNTVVANATSGTAVPTALAVGSCSTAGSAINWTTNTGFGCNTSITAAAAPLSGLTGAGTGVLTWGATPTSANFFSAITNETGSGAVVGGTSPTITGGTHTAATQLSTSSGNVLTAPTYRSGYFYLGGEPGITTTSTNTTPIVDGTEYASIAFAFAPLNITAVGWRTSSSSANLGASVKACVYAADGTGGTPGTLLGSTATGTAVGDAATTTDVLLTLDSAAAIPQGPFWIAILQTSTTGLRFVEKNGIQSIGQYEGTSTNTLLGGTGVIYGYTVAQAYASGCASPFGTAVVNNTVGLALAVVYKAQ